MEIRDAVVEDAAAACEVMRRSIAELCVPDHGNDPEFLRRWLANKTPEVVAAWIRRPKSSVLVAVDGEAILAVGCVTDKGEIVLNYVSPDVRFRGVSRAMMRALETRARQRGNSECRLFSTATAFPFYRAGGYRETGPAQMRFGMSSCYPMVKRLTKSR